jgi:prepilin-type N-terminal cleavage/methylation domain-containing protein
MNPSAQTKTSGYTLVEISVVLVIISLLTAGGLTLGAGMVNQAAHIDTGKILNQIDQSLRDYYTVNGRLPCPAARDLAITDTNFGREVNGGACNSTGAITGTSYSNDVRIGMIPVRALGLSDRAASDKYGNRILYAVTRQLTDASVFGASDGAVHVLPATGAEILDDAAYFVWSAGKDHKGAPLYTTAATPTTCSGTALDAENCDNDNIFRDAPFNNGEVVANFFDDHARWVPKFHLTAAESHSDTLWAANGDANLYSVGTDTNTANTNVGIGTTAPSASMKLHVMGNIQADGGGLLARSGAPTLYLRDTNARSSMVHMNDNKLYLLRGDGNDSTAWDSSRPFVLDMATNYVGIGEETPDEKLHVMGSIRADQGNLQARGTSGSVYLRDTTVGEYSAGVHVNQNKLYVLRAPTDSIAYDSTRSFTVDLANQRVGIGTANPMSRLDIVSDGSVSHENDVNLYAFNNADGPIFNMRRARGSLAAPANLHSGDEITQLRGTAFINGGWSDVSNIVMHYRGNGANSLSELLFTVSGGSRWMRMESSGQTTLTIPGFYGTPNAMTDWPSGWGGGLSTWDVVGASAYFNEFRARSDRRLKESITPLHQDSIEKLRKLQPVSYYWKDRTAPDIRYGFIAQDVREVWPELVQGKESENTYLGISYDDFIAPTVLAVQVLLDRQDAMAAQIEALKAEGASGQQNAETSAERDGQAFMLLAASAVLGFAGMLLGVVIGRRMTR